MNGKNIITAIAWRIIELENKLRNTVPGTSCWSSRRGRLFSVSPGTAASAVSPSELEFELALDSVVSGCRSSSLRLWSDGTGLPAGAATSSSAMSCERERCEQEWVMKEGNEVVREKWIFIVSLPLAGSDFRVTTYAPIPVTP